MVVGKVEDNVANLLEEGQVADGGQGPAELLEAALHNDVLHAGNGGRKALLGRREEGAVAGADLDGLAHDVRRLVVVNQLNHV